MTDQYNAGKRALGEILTTTSAKIEVPQWQRDYSWESTQVEQFWTDLVVFSDQHPGQNLNKHEYFLGSMVLVEDDKNTNLLLDGQQRLATATILLSVIASYLVEYDQNASTRLRQKYIVDYDDASKENRYTVTLSVFDREFFRIAIQDGQPDAIAPEYYSHKLIKHARDYFTTKFEEQYTKLGRGEPAKDWALRIRQVLTDHMSVVVVSSLDEDSAATVFETLNDRGIGLSNARPSPAACFSAAPSRPIETPSSSAGETFSKCPRSVM
ncbi:MAG: DUF262 domain-containing protein [Dehalococcoidia bacterium]